jgi:hypothetical protein
VASGTSTFSTNTFQFDLPPVIRYAVE